MSKRSQEKRRARAKEKAKQMRREKGTSPLSRLVGGEAGDGVECWKQYDAEGLDPMVNYAIFRGVKRGGFAGAFVLVDYLCIGLKNAFYRLDVVPSEIVARYKGRDSAMRTVRVEAAEVRREVGAAVRWAREHDFKLPRDWERCVKIIGGEVDVDGGDVSAFGTEEGGLHYVGLKRDLEKRLLAETLDEFLAREDVSYEFMDGLDFDEEDEFGEDEFEEDEEFDEEDGEEEDLDWEEAEEVVAEGKDLLRGKMLAAVRRWCFATGRAPHPALEEAIEVMAEASGQAFGADPDDPELVAEAKNAEEQLLELEPAEKREAIRTARVQLREFAKSFNTGEDLEKAMGLEPEEDAESNGE